MAYYLSEINERCRRDPLGLIAACDALYHSLLEEAADRIIANLDLFGFELTSDELANIDALERDGRTGLNPDTFNG